MTAQKQSSFSFASIISGFSIVFYCVGFLRVELQLNKQKKRISALENVAETKPPSLFSDIVMLFKNATESHSNKLSRNKRQADSTKNTTEDEHKADTMQKINRLLSEVKLQLCNSMDNKCSSGPPGPPGPPGVRGDKGVRGRRGQKGRSGNKGHRGIMGSVGPRGEAGVKGQKGDMGPAGMPGPKGEPGESISAPVVSASPSKLIVNESGTASFQCSISGNPTPTIKWSREESQKELSQSVSGGLLFLKKVSGSDSGVYRCSASNILGQAEGLVRLVVNVRPRVSFHPGPRYAIEGSSFTLPACHVTGYPAPVVRWRKSSGQLPQGRVMYNNSALQILHVRKSDSDAYFCSAGNLLGKAEKKTLLVVVSIPRFNAKPPLKLVARSGDTLTLNCSATGDPQPVISWKKPGGQLPVGRNQQINGALVLRDLQLGDAGNYICVAISAGVFDVEAVTDLEVKDGLDASYILGDLDSKYLDKLKAYLDPVLLSSTRSRFVNCWRAKTDGWAASTFHSNCDGKGPTVTIIKVGSYIFGGYTDVSWSSSGGYALSSKSFIYSLYNINGYAPVKLQIKSGRHGNAIYRYPNYGPTFGNGFDIYIANNAARNLYSYSGCGYVYPLPLGYSSCCSSCTFYTGSHYFTPTDVEVFYETTT